MLKREGIHSILEEKNILGKKSPRKKEIPQKEGNPLEWIKEIIHFSLSKENLVFDNLATP